MENINKLFGEISSVSNPFKQECIEKIGFYYRKKNTFGDVINEFTASVKFKNGSTSGEQEFEVSTFPELYQKVMDFCKSL